jgi:hypothetical protein
MSDNLRTTSLNGSNGLSINQQNPSSSAIDNSAWNLAMGRTLPHSGRNSPDVQAQERDFPTRPTFARSVSLPAAEIPRTLNTDPDFGRAFLRPPSPDNINEMILGGRAPFLN